MEDLDAASLEDVQAFFRTWYAPNNAVVSVVGDCDPPRSARGWRAYFGGIPANPDLPEPPSLALPALLGEERREVVTTRCRSPRIYLGFRAPVYGDPRLDALDLASQILAGGKGSRLHRSLVREERMAQDVAFFTLGFVGGSVSAGWVTVRPGVDLAAVEAAFLEELEKIATEPPTEDELARARALVESDELGSLARVEERADRLSMYATLFDDPALINTLLPRYLAVTAEQIRDAAAEVLRADNRVVLTYLPEAGAGTGEEAA
jgi:predicted Zn-dependent peptidase